VEEIFKGKIKHKGKVQKILVKHDVDESNFGCIYTISFEDGHQIELCHNPNTDEWEEREGRVTWLSKKVGKLIAQHFD
jgi:calcineurin-like phosphoesterase family protein